jgi:hypothetical protein
MCFQRSDAISFGILMSPFLKMKLGWFKTLPTAYSNRQMIEHNYICGFSKLINKLSLIAKKAQHIDILLCGFHNA